MKVGLQMQTVLVAVVVVAFIPNPYLHKAGFAVMRTEMIRCYVLLF